MKIRFVFKRRRITRRTTTALLRETNTQTCVHPLCSIQHNNARLSFLSFVTHFRDTETQRQCPINSIDMCYIYTIN